MILQALSVREKDLSTRLATVSDLMILYVNC